MLLNPKIHTWCIWGGVGALVLWLGGFWFFADFMPPPSPDKPADDLAEMYLDNKNTIRFGLILTLFGSALFATYIAAVSVHMKRIEGRFSVLTYVQLGLGSILVLEFITPLFFWQACAYRDDRSPEVIEALSDVGWFLFISVVSTVVVELLVIGVAILADQRENPVFPRWAGYLNLWCSLLIVPGSFCVYFKDGPLAWNGVFSWWIPVSAFVVWIVTMSILMAKDVPNMTAEGDAPQSSETLPSPHLDALTAEVESLRAQVNRLETGTAMRDNLPAKG